MSRLPLLLTFLVLAVPGAAQASSRAACPVGVTAHCRPVAVATAQSGLPFTGSDVLLLAGGCVVLIAAGAIVRWATTLAAPGRRAVVEAEQLPVGELRPALVSVDGRRSTVA